MQVGHILEGKRRKRRRGDRIADILVELSRGGNRRLEVYRKVEVQVGEPGMA